MPCWSARCGCESADNTVNSGLDSHDTAGASHKYSLCWSDIHTHTSAHVLQVADLEEERRKLRMELKFRAKYHGQHALEMGLTPEQLLLVEEYVDSIKGHKNDEARLVDQLRQRVSGLGMQGPEAWVECRMLEGLLSRLEQLWMCWAGVPYPLLLLPERGSLVLSFHVASDRVP